MFSLFKQAPRKGLAGCVDPLFAVIGLAIVWHFCIALLERCRCPTHARPPMSKLLLLAEIEVLKTLKGELKRLLRSGSKCEQKLREVNQKLRELEDAERTNI
jgi:hypothetical protein